MKQQIVKLGVATAIVILFAAPGWTADTPKGTKLSSSDASFVKEAAQGGMTEVQLGKLAQTKSSDEAVKDFGKKMEQDHSKANEELKKLASDKGLELSSELDKKHQSQIDKLGKLSGAKFDKDFMAAMVSDHKDTIKQFESTSEKAKDAELKKFASQTLPTLKSHLQLAESVNTKVKSAK